ncbi:MAG TPA: hypothetical protein VHM19_17715 [Polyangiales bacterium]|jgi:hypothetical protein|nr:hypothetical protein [Polyangiales bacterium]
MNVRSWAAIAGVLVSGLGSACGTGDASPPVAEADYVQALAAAENDQADRCCKQAGLGGVEAGWKAHAEMGEKAWLPPASSGATYDGVAAGDCVDAYEHQACSLAKDGYRGHVPQACQDVYARGTTKLGERCTSYYQCEQPPGKVTGCGGYEVIDNAVVKTCVEIREAGEGAACGAAGPHVDVVCKGNLLCDDQQLECVRPAGRGEPCLTGAIWGDTCAKGSVCDRLSKRCVEPTPVGKPCDESHNLCENYACVNSVCVAPLFFTGPCTP